VADFSHYLRLLLSAVLRARAAAAPVTQQAIDISWLPAMPTAGNPPHIAATVDRWDRQTDGRTDGHRTVA